MTKVYILRQKSLVLELVCSVKSNPASEVKWTTPDLIPIEWEERVPTSGSSNTIVISITKPEDVHLGTYACTAVNSLGQARQTISLKGN